MSLLLKHWKTIIFLVLITLVFMLCKLTLNYRDKYLLTSQQLLKQQAVLTQMKQDQRDVARLDAKYTRELANAKQTIEKLHDDVRHGKRRLHVNAKCQQVSESATSGVANGTTAEITANAEQYYWRLRDQIEIASKQISGLQHYIHQQCLK